MFKLRFFPFICLQCASINLRESKENEMLIVNMVSKLQIKQKIKVGQNFIRKNNYKYLLQVRFLQKDFNYIEILNSYKIFQ